MFPGCKVLPLCAMGSVDVWGTSWKTGLPNFHLLANAYAICLPLDDTSCGCARKTDGELEMPLPVNYVYVHPMVT